MIAVAKTRKSTAQRYAELLSKVLPKPIETEAENERALEIVNELMTRGEKNLTDEERWLMRMLVRLIEDFEEKAYPIDEAPPRAVLKTLMEDRGLKQIDLAPLFGGRSRVSDVLAGKRDISKAQAKSLAEFFKVPADLFI
ncbi:MAG: type II toxin-antitoxin system HigA family antitoxin [Blastocatellales bacterium]